MKLKMLYQLTAITQALILLLIFILDIITALLSQMTQFHKMRAKNYKPLQNTTRSQ